MALCQPAENGVAGGRRHMAKIGHAKLRTPHVENALVCGIRRRLEDAAQDLMAFHDRIESGGSSGRDLTFR